MDVPSVAEALCTHAEEPDLGQLRCQLLEKRSSAEESEFHVPTCRPECGIYSAPIVGMPGRSGDAMSESRESAPQNASSGSDAPFATALEPRPRTVEEKPKARTGWWLTGKACLALGIVYRLAGKAMMGSCLVRGLAERRKRGSGMSWGLTGKSLMAPQTRGARVPRRKTAARASPTRWSTRARASSSTSWRISSPWWTAKP